MNAPTKVNWQSIAVGLPEFGKTSIVASLTRRFLDEGYWVFAHDKNKQFKQGCRVYPNVAAWKSVARTASERNEPMPRGASFRGAWGEVRDLARELGERHNSVDSVHMPMFVPVDESSLMDTSGSTHVDKDDREVMANRRHLGIAFHYSIQTKTMLTQEFWTFANHVYLMAQPEQRLRELEEACHLRRGALRVLLNLPEHHYVHVRPGKGYAVEAL